MIIAKVEVEFSAQFDGCLVELEDRAKEAAKMEQSLLYILLNVSCITLFNINESILMFFLVYSCDHHSLSLFIFCPATQWM